MSIDVYLTEAGELDWLPERSAVRSRCGLLAEKGPDGNWYTLPDSQPLPLPTLLAGGVRLLDLGCWPGEPASVSLSLEFFKFVKKHQSGR